MRMAYPPVRSFAEQVRMRASIDKRQHRLLFQIDQEPVGLYVAFAERFHAARKLMVVEFFLKGDVVFQFVDDFFKQRDVKSALYGELVAFFLNCEVIFTM